MFINKTALRFKKNLKKNIFFHNMLVEHVVLSKYGALQCII